MNWNRLFIDFITILIFHLAIGLIVGVVLKNIEGKQFCIYVLPIVGLSTYFVLGYLATRKIINSRLKLLYCLYFLSLILQTVIMDIIDYDYFSRREFILNLILLISSAFIVLKFSTIQWKSINVVLIGFSVLILFIIPNPIGLLINNSVVGIVEISHPLHKVS